MFSLRVVITGDNSVITNKSSTSGTTFSVDLFCSAGHCVLYHCKKIAQLVSAVCLEHLSKQDLRLSRLES